MFYLLLFNSKVFGVLKISITSHENTCAGAIFIAVAGLRPASALKVFPAQVFSRSYCEIFKNTLFVEHLRKQLFCGHLQISLNSLLTLIVKTCCIAFHNLLLTKPRKNNFSETCCKRFQKESFFSLKLQASRAQPPT